MSVKQPRAQQWVVNDFVYVTFLALFTMCYLCSIGDYWRQNWVCFVSATLFYAALSLIMLWRQWIENKRYPILLSNDRLVQGLDGADRMAHLLSRKLLRKPDLWNIRLMANCEQRVAMLHDNNLLSTWWLIDDELIHHSSYWMNAKLGAGETIQTLTITPLGTVAVTTTHGARFCGDLGWKVMKPHKELDPYTREETTGPYLDFVWNEGWRVWHDGHSIHRRTKDHHHVYQVPSPRNFSRITTLVAHEEYCCFVDKRDCTRMMFYRFGSPETRWHKGAYAIERLEIHGSELHMSTTNDVVVMVFDGEKLLTKDHRERKYNKRYLSSGPVRLLVNDKTHRAKIWTHHSKTWEHHGLHGQSKCTEWDMNVNVGRALQVSQASHPALPFFFYSKFTTLYSFQEQLLHNQNYLDIVIECHQ